MKFFVPNRAKYVKRIVVWKHRKPPEFCLMCIQVVQFITKCVIYNLCCLLSILLLIGVRWSSALSEISLLMCPHMRAPGQSDVHTPVLYRFPSTHIYCRCIYLDIKICRYTNTEIDLVISGPNPSHSYSMLGYSNWRSTPLKLIAIT